MNASLPSFAEPPGRTRTIQSVDRAAALLKAIADSPHAPTVGELAEATGLNRSTAWRLLATLDAHGLVERDPVSQRYRIGYAMLRIAASAEHDAVVRRARPVLEKLAVETGEAVNLALARGLNLIYVDQVDAPQVLAPNWLGRVVPLHATSSGKAFLAYLGRDERDAMLGKRLEKFTATTVTDRRALEQELGRAREQGYAVCVGELEESLYGASAAVLSVERRPLAIVSVWGPAGRVTEKRLPAVGRLALAAAEEIKERLR
jgi:DNA-binding IclR family transcriptional regulator